jgi:ferredoxin
MEGSHIMDTRTIKIVFFSPTETTAKIVNGLALGIDHDIVSRIDLTPPGARYREVEQMREELTIIGTPVYAGRVPAEAILRLRRIKGDNTPAVIVVVYGNREYEDALLELRDIAAELGFRPIAGGAFIGEHSYSSETTPIAPGRPDGEDMENARRFGESIQEKISRLQTLDDMPVLKVPGNYPYVEWDRPPKMAPVTAESLCALCEECAAACPTAAIIVEESVSTDKEACIRCSACIRKCPSGAREWEDTRIDQIRKWLNENCRQRKEPQIYL